MFKCHLANVPRQVLCAWSAFQLFPGHRLGCEYAFSRFTLKTFDDSGWFGSFRFKSFKYGICMPDKCSPDDIAAIVNLAIESIPKNISSLLPFLNKTIDGSDVVCQPESYELDSGSIVAM